MNTKGIPDFTDSELWVVRSTLKERYGKEIELQMADTEVALGGNHEGMSWCPTFSPSSNSRLNASGRFFIITRNISWELALKITTSSAMA